MIMLIIPEASPSLNELKGKHWAHAYRMRKHWSLLVMVAKNEAHIPFREPDERVKVRIIREGRRLLDYDNLVGGTKILMDSLREQHLIVDDSPEHIVPSYDQRQIPKSDYPRTIVEIQKI